MILYPMKLVAVHGPGDMLEGDSHVEWFEGNFEEYEEDKKRRLGPQAGSSRTASSTGS